MHTNVRKEENNNTQWMQQYYCLREIYGQAYFIMVQSACNMTWNRIYLVEEENYIGGGRAEMVGGWTVSSEGGILLYSIQYWIHPSNHK